MKKIIFIFILFFITVFASAKWWIFGQNENEITINYLYINGVPYEEIKDLISFSKGTLTNGLIYIKGKAKSKAGQIGMVEISIDDQLTWQKAELESSGAFVYSFQPVIDKVYNVFIKITDTTGKTNNLDDKKFMLKVVNIDFRAIIEKTLRKMAESYGAEDEYRFMQCVSDDFINGTQMLRNAILNDFKLFKNIKIEFTIASLAIDNKNNVFVMINYKRNLVSASDNKVYFDNGSTNFIFKVTGQEAKLFSMSNPIIFGLSDADNLANPTTGPTEEIKLIPTATPVTVYSGSMSLHSTVMQGESFKFSTFQKFTEPNGNPTQGDIMFISVFFLLKSGTGIINMGIIPIENVTEVPETGYSYPGHLGGPTCADTPSWPGKTFALKLSDGKYAVIEITSVQTLASPPCPNDQEIVNIKYKYNKSGSNKF